MENLGQRIRGATTDFRPGLQKAMRRHCWHPYAARISGDLIFPPKPRSPLGPGTRRTIIQNPPYCPRRWCLCHMSRPLQPPRLDRTRNERLSGEPSNLLVCLDTARTSFALLALKRLQLNQSPN